ncbi:MAG: hypothetical protein WCS96_02355 [Victivallales bacterium]
MPANPYFNEELSEENIKLLKDAGAKELPDKQGIKPSDQLRLREQEFNQKQQVYQNIASAIGEQVAKGVIEISGEVVDEEGKPISQVTMSIAGMRNNFFKPDSKKGFNETKIFDGKFTVHVTGCNSAAVHFTKKGYSDEEIHCDLPSDFALGQGGVVKEKMQTEIKEPANA